MGVGQSAGGASAVSVGPGRTPVDDQLGRGGGEPIDRRLGEELVTEERQPLGQVTVPVILVEAPVPLGDQVVEVAGRRSVRR